MPLLRVLPWSGGGLLACQLPADDSVRDRMLLVDQTVDRGTGVAGHCAASLPSITIFFILFFA